MVKAQHGHFLFETKLLCGNWWMDRLFKNRKGFILHQVILLALLQEHQYGYQEQGIACVCGDNKGVTCDKVPVTFLVPGPHPRDRGVRVNVARRRGARTGTPQRRR